MFIKKLVVIAVVSVLLACSGVPNTTYAIEAQKNEILNTEYQNIGPLWINIHEISPYISAQGKILYSEVYIKATKSTSSISGVMYLQRYDSGRWVNVKSWSSNGTSSVVLSKTYTGSSGAIYRTRVIVTVDGERAEATSGTLRI